MFSMYFAATTSMTQEQCQAHLGHDREKLLAQWKYGAETALANAHFLSSTELKSLVAFVIYVVSMNFTIPVRLQDLFCVSAATVDQRLTSTDDPPIS